MRAGDELPSRTVGPLGVHEFVRYQGASGDLNPLHHDPEVATQAGYDAVFCPGMLSAGLLGSHLANVLGAESVRQITVSFREIVWAGEVLTLGARVTSDDDGLATLSIWCERPDGSLAVTGEAVIAT